MHQASVGFHCPECAKQGSQKVYSGFGAIATKPVLTQVIIGINLAVFLLSLVVDGASALRGDTGQLQIDLGLIARALAPTSNGLGVHVIGVGEGEWYRLVTSGFLHFGVLHLAVNMYALWVLGSVVEQMGGRARMGTIYGVSMLAGSLGALLITPDSLTAGASGAIFGLMGAILLAHRAQGIPFQNSPLIGVLMINLVITFGLSNISVGGHLGGLVGGAIAGWALFDLPRREGIPKQVPWAICAAVAAICVVASVMVASSASLT